MSSIHDGGEVVGTVHMSGHAYLTPWWLLGAALIGFHLVRALSTREWTARRWMQKRGFSTDERSVDQVRRHLLRLRWFRVLAAVVLVGVCALSLSWARTAISFLSLPFLLSVLGAEALAPEPRRARVRVAALARRSRSYFAPLRALVVTRIAIAAGLVLSLAAVPPGGDRARTAALVHAGVLVVGLVALEACLSRISTRALPDRQPDLAVDTALRVASARAATAAGLVFGFFGMTYATGVLFAATDWAAPSWLRLAISQILMIVLLTVVAAALTLVQPLRAWHPRESS